MKISGLMKLTLLDFPGHVACTVFLAGCNFRCPFCHNGSLVRGGDLDISKDELFAFLKKRRGVLDGVCITGGEPLMNAEVGGLIREIKALGYLIKLDTNGSYPERLGELLEEGVIDYVAMDIKSGASGYASACGVSVDVEKIQKSIELIKSSGVEHEFRTTVVKGLHTEEDIVGCAKLIGADEPYFLQSYKESDDIIDPNGLSSFNSDELARILAAAQSLNPQTQLRGV